MCITAHTHTHTSKKFKPHNLQLLLDKVEPQLWRQLKLHKVLISFCHTLTHLFFKKPSKREEEKKAKSLACSKNISRGRVQIVNFKNSLFFLATSRRSFPDDLQIATVRAINRRIQCGHKMFLFSQRIAQCVCVCVCCI